MYPLHFRRFERHLKKLLNCFIGFNKCCANIRPFEMMLGLGCGESYDLTCSGTGCALGVSPHAIPHSQANVGTHTTPAVTRISSRSIAKITFTSGVDKIHVNYMSHISPCLPFKRSLLLILNVVSVALHK